MRGEYSHCVHHTSYIKGSPPLARGVLAVFCLVGSRYRITPACAGSTYRCQPGWHRKEDHPRLRGEYKMTTFIKSFQQGSPPLARGVQVSEVCCIVPSRITPACAGSTIAYKEKVDAIGDHPRLRGEYLYQPLMQSKSRGSPPLARGVPL